MIRSLNTHADLLDINDVTLSPASTIPRELAPEIQVVSDISRNASGGYPDTEFTEIHPAELALRLRQPASLQLLDVREPPEWNEAHIETARLVPIYSIEEKLKDLDPDQETIVYCARGARGRAAALYLSVFAGFKCVRNLKGGFSSWLAEGKPSAPG
jgi:rhodanese-related sulfurtransferase